MKKLFLSGLVVLTLCTVALAWTNIFGWSIDPLTSQSSNVLLDNGTQYRVFAHGLEGGKADFYLKNSGGVVVWSGTVYPEITGHDYEFVYACSSSGTYTWLVKEVTGVMSINVDFQKP